MSSEEECRNMSPLQPWKGKSRASFQYSIFTFIRNILGAHKRGSLSKDVFILKGTQRKPRLRIPPISSFDAVLA
eukprot:726276-Amphidinium_carterae.1